MICALNISSRLVVLLKHGREIEFGGQIGVLLENVGDASTPRPRRLGFETSSSRLCKCFLCSDEAQNILMLNYAPFHARDLTSRLLGTMNTILSFFFEFFLIFLISTLSKFPVSNDSTFQL